LAYGVGDGAFFGFDLGDSHQPGDFDGFFVHDAFFDEVVGAHHITVVAGVYDNCVIVEFEFCEGFEDFTYAAVDLCYEAPVLCDQFSNGLFVAAVFLLACFSFYPVSERLVFFERVGEVWGQVDFLWVVFVIERAEEGHVGFEEVDVQYEWLVAAALEEIACLCFEEFWFAVFDRASCGE